MIDNKYIVNKLVGMGGSSKVFEATDWNGTKVAIKAIRKDKNYKKTAASNMLNKEFELLEKLHEHPNIVNVIDYNHNGKSYFGNTSEDVMYNVLEYAENGTLGRFIRITGAVEERIARLFAIQVWDAIKFLHKQDYAHLDIKLENILLDEFFNIKVADLGSWSDVSLTKGYAQVRRGTTNYMAPEVAILKSRKRFDAKAADIYSLGVTLYLLLTGEFPNANEMENPVKTWGSDREESDDWEMVDDSESPKENLNLSKEIRLLLQSMLSPNPSKRPDISEILESSWCSAPFEPELMEEAFTEMEYRRKHVQRYLQSKKNSRQHS